MLAAYVSSFESLRLSAVFSSPFGPGWYVAGRLTPGIAETSTLTASGLAGGFL